MAPPRPDGARVASEAASEDAASCTHVTHYIVYFSQLFSTSKCMTLGSRMALKCTDSIPTSTLIFVAFPVGMQLDKYVAGYKTNMCLLIC